MTSMENRVVDGLPWLAAVGSVAVTGLAITHKGAPGGRPRSAGRRVPSSWRSVCSGFGAAMSSDPTRPADTLTMSVFHCALRRDLERSEILLGSPDTLSPRRSRRLGRHLQWMMHTLRWHHEGEDHHLWPLLHEREPGSSAVLDVMQAEHHAIDGPVLALEAHARGLVAGRTKPRDVRDALNALAKPVMEHLEHEEGEAMEIVSRVLSHRNWNDFEQRAWINGYTMWESIRFVVWMVDGVEWNRSIRRRAGLPAPICWAVVKPLALIAHVPGLSIWSGTPAVRVKSRVS